MSLPDNRTDVLIKLYFQGVVSNAQFIKAYKWIGDFIQSNEIKKKVNIVYSLGGRFMGKMKRAQFFSKKETEFQESLSEHELRFIEIYKLDDVEHAFHALDHSFYFSLNQAINLSLELPDPPTEMSPGDISFKLNYDCWKNLLSDDFIERVASDLVKVMDNGPTKVIYGVIAKMPTDIGIDFYTSGIGKLSMSKEEEKFVNLFDDRKIKNKLWEPFWGNFITQKHFKNKMHHEELVKLIGKENIKSITKTLTFFKMPISIHDFKYESRLHNKYRKEIYSLFLKYDSVIKE